MTFDPFHFLQHNAKTKSMKGRKRNSETSKLLGVNKISYLVNLSTIGGGAALYTEWQIIFPLNNEMPHYSITQQTLIMIISVIMLVAGFFGQKKEDNEGYLDE